MNESKVIDAWLLSFNNLATPFINGITSFHNYILMYLILVFTVIFWFLARSIYLFYESKNADLLNPNYDPLVETVS